MGLAEDDIVDDLEESASFHSEAIRTLYDSFADKAPVMLFDVQEQRIYAYPYVEFRKELSTRSQRSLKQQYERALQENQMVVFVRDNDQQRLVSFSWQL
ncbi:MAG: hypothetical protein Q8P50_04050 [Bacillota bacterium]|nr:hypothetical protein [Bacillota bacterium]